MAKTVKEIIAELSQFPADAEVVIDGVDEIEGNVWRSHARSIRKIRFRPVTDNKIPQRPCKQTSEGTKKVILY